MDYIKVLVTIDQETEVHVSISELINNINDTPMTTRWNAIASLLNGIQVNDQLEEGHKTVVVKYLKSKLELFEKNNTP